MLLSADGDILCYNFRLAFGTPLVRLDLVPSNFKPPHNKRNFLSWISGGIIGNVKTLGALFEFDYTPRNFLTATVSLSP
jgi:hypothetical protein